MVDGAIVIVRICRDDLKQEKEFFISGLLIVDIEVEVRPL